MNSPGDLTIVGNDAAGRKTSVKIIICYPERDEEEKISAVARFPFTKVG